MEKEALKTQLKLLQPSKNQEADYLKSYDSILDFVLDKVLNDVSLYCHIPIEELPDSIFQTVVMMASNLIGSYGLVNDEAANADDRVSETKDGDTDVKFLSPTARLQAALSLSSISSDFRGILNRIRRLPE
jgi:hypothetical protein